VLFVSFVVKISLGETMPSHVRPTTMTDALYEYVLTIGLREPAILHELREETSRLPEGEWQTAPEQGPLLDLLVKITNAKRILEVGTFTGYGALWFALASPEVRVITCDVSGPFTAIGKKYWAKAGVADRIDLRLAPATETLKKLIAAGEQFDLAFIDADKENVVEYFELCLRLVKVGGLILIDNTLWDGRPANPTEQEASTVAIRDLNGKLHGDERIDLCFLPFADGLTIARKRRA
jgi:predicted O-methyltransferase YrrM